MKLALVCVGGGRGARFGGDKLGQPLAGRPVLEVALSSLRLAFPLAPLVVVVAGDRLELWRTRLDVRFPGLTWVAGGERRQDSVRAGVDAAAALGCDTVCVHDAARPLVRPEDVRAAVGALGDADGAILCQAVADTVKRVDAGGFLVATLSREELRLALTPQVVRVAAYDRAWSLLGPGRLWTDEAALLETAGLRVRSVVATYPNPKLTTPEDLPLMQALAACEAPPVGGGVGS